MDSAYAPACNSLKDFDLGPYIAGVTAQDSRFATVRGEIRQE